MSVYLSRFLNVPPTPIPSAGESAEGPTAFAKEFLELLDKRHSINEAAEIVAKHAGSQVDQDRLLSLLGNALLREDRNFHAIQMIEAICKESNNLIIEDPQFDRLPILIAAARYLAAHSATVRRQGQTFDIAWRLQRGEKIYEGIE